VSGAGAALALLLAAASLPAADEPPAGAVLAELPFVAAGEPNAVRIDLAPPGSRPLVLSVDTGATQSMATVGGARGLGIIPSRDKQTYRRATRLGRDIELWVDTRWSDTGARAGGEYALVGGAFLAHYVLELDFPRSRVRFLDADRYRVPERATGGAVSLPLRLVANRPILEIAIGTARVPAVISTGAPGTLIVPGGWAKEGGVRPDPEANAEIKSQPGTGRLEAGTAERVAIGPFEDRDVPLLVAPDGLYDAGPRSEALLGVDYLKRFVVRIDYPHRLVWIADGGEG